MWKGKPQTSGWTSEMWVALNLIKCSKQGVGCFISLFFKDWNEFRWQEILPVCQRTTGCQRILETENCRMAACFCCRIFTDLKYWTGPCWFDVLKYSPIELMWKNPLGSNICTSRIGLVWTGGGQMRRLITCSFKTRQQTGLNSACTFQRVNPRGRNIRDIFTSSGND